jgi:hypothetical protein
VVGVTVTAPATATAGVQFTVFGSAALHNNGPDGPANADTTFTMNLPVDCTATSATTVVVPGRQVAVSVPVSVSRAWNVRCTQAGAHQFTIDASVALSAGQTFTDPNPGNNAGSGIAMTTVN